MAQEIWKQVPGYEGLYWASTRGRIRNSRGQLKSQRRHESAGGWIYKKVNLWKKNKMKTFRVQRLILLAFAGPPAKRIVARHLDGNTFNNNIDNLEWGTQSDNVLDFLRRREEEKETNWRAAQ